MTPSPLLLLLLLLLILLLLLLRSLLLMLMLLLLLLLRTLRPLRVVPRLKHDATLSEAYTQFRRQDSVPKLRSLLRRRWGITFQSSSSSRGATSKAASCSALDGGGDRGHPGTTVTERSISSGSSGGGCSSDRGSTGGNCNTNNSKETTELRSVDAEEGLDRAPARRNSQGNYSTLLYSTLLYSTLPCSTLLYAYITVTLLYSTVLYDAADT